MQNIRGNDLISNNLRYSRSIQHWSPLTLQVHAIQLWSFQCRMKVHSNFHSIQKDHSTDPCILQVRSQSLLVHIRNIKGCTLWGHNILMSIHQDHSRWVHRCLHKDHNILPSSREDQNRHTCQEYNTCLALHNQSFAVHIIDCTFEAHTAGHMDLDLHNTLQLVRNIHNMLAHNNLQVSPRIHIRFHSIRLIFRSLKHK